MLDNLSKTITEVSHFTNKHLISAEFHILSIHELWGEYGEKKRDASWAKFEQHGGVYCILSEDHKKVKYVGMSLSDTGGRLFQWVFPSKTQESPLSGSLIGEDMVLCIVLKDEPYMAPALESYLISKVSPTYNRRK